MIDYNVITKKENQNEQSSGNCSKTNPGNYRER
jgi:hypothetical protein